MTYNIIFIIINNTINDSVKLINASSHKGVEMDPIEVNDSNQLKVWKKYYSQGVNSKPFKFAIGYHVRISRDKVVFKGGETIRSEVFGGGRKNIYNHHIIPPALNSKRLRPERFEK